MAELITEIQSIVDGYLKNTTFTDIAFGTVTSVAPLKIMIKQTMLSLSGEQLVTVEWLIGELAKGDEVLLLRAMEGQKFVVLSRIYNQQPEQSGV